MPKLEAASLTIKISLEQIIDTGNIREIAKYSPNEKGEYPQEIIDLAMSIKTIGQLQPIVVKLHGVVDVIKLYELIAGFRRYAAFLYLCSIGEDYNQIEARVFTGEKLIIQLVENIQREDLTAPEREAAIYQLLESGIKQKEIAAKLSKTPAFVSVNISAYKMRQAGQQAGIDLSDVETSTFGELLSVPENELLFILRKLIESGGTRAAAKILATPYKKQKEVPPEHPIIPSIVLPAGENESTLPIKDMASGEIASEPPQKTKPKVKPLLNKEKPIETEHRKIELNIVLTVIYDYIENMKKMATIYIGKPDKGRLIEKIEAAKDILALIHKRLEDV
jgi:ParB/RepB/Spo0J family partition protein